MAPRPGGPRPGGAGSVVYLVIGLVLVTIVAGVAVGFAASDDDSSADVNGAAAASENGAGNGGGNPSGGGLPETPTTVATTPTTPPPVPAQAAVNDCVHVTASGSLSGTGSCAEGGAPYLVTEVLPLGGACSNGNASWITSGDFVLCMQVNVIETYCYSIPEASGWITPATCELPGTVHVIDVVPGATSDSACTTDYQWNRWYNIPYPQQIVCVMSY